MKLAYQEPTPPWLHAIIGKELAGPLGLARDRVPDGARVYEIDGANCSTLSGCYGEIARAFSLPAYFGGNLNALLDCLCDGDIVSGNPILVLVEHANEFLSLEPEDVLNGFLDTFQTAAKRWARGLEWPWNSDPTPFHVLFCFDTPVDERRFRAFTGGS